MKFSEKILSQLVTSLCLSKSVDHIVISPGSRNAPLSIGFTQHPSFKNYSIVDERCAAFFALGMAQQLGKPVAVVCTSGSALLNYYPAVAEAFYSNIPLVVLSADRPAHLIDVGDGQTIRQENVYQNHILYSANCKEGDGFFDFNVSEISKALTIAEIQKGPVHINVPFTEPLYKMVAALDEHVVPYAEKQVAIPTPKYLDQLPLVHTTKFVDVWNRSAKKIVLVGVLPPSSLAPDYIQLLAEDESVLVMTETTSNLHHPSFIAAIDQLIAPMSEIELTHLQPEVLLTFGGLIVSKKIKAFLRKYKPTHHFHVDEKTGYDTFFSLTNHFKVPIDLFFNHIGASLVQVPSNYQNEILKLKARRTERHAQYVEEIPYSDFKVFSALFSSLPTGVDLQLANSTTIRYAQLYDLDHSIHTYCNRGTSGIDGSTSTAIGAAHISEKQTVFITGDLSFFYDSNALWNNYVPSHFRIIIVNNSGGGIFRILPEAKNATHFDTFFETSHRLTAQSLATQFGFAYQKATNIESLSEILPSFYEASEQPKILELMTPAKVNDKILLDYFKFIV